MFVNGLAAADTPLKVNDEFSRASSYLHNDSKTMGPTRSYEGDDQ